MEIQQTTKLIAKVEELEKRIFSLENKVAKYDRARARARIFKLLYFGLIVVLGIILYFYLRPFYQSVLSVYQFGSEQQQNIAELQENIDTNQIAELIEFFQ